MSQPLANWAIVPSPVLVDIKRNFVLKAVRVIGISLNVAFPILIPLFLLILTYTSLNYSLTLVFYVFLVLIVMSPI